MDQLESVRETIPFSVGNLLPRLIQVNARLAALTVDSFVIRPSSALEGKS
jgi:hypothetical protein